MSDPYPEVISRYFSAADRRDLAALTDCFVADATLTDADRTYHGHAEIRAWREAAGPAYEYVVEVLDYARTDDDTYLVDTNVAGDFPASPVGLKFRFVLRGRLIADLRIGP